MKMAMISQGVTHRIDRRAHDRHLAGELSRLQLDDLQSRLEEPDRCEDDVHLALEQLFLLLQRQRDHTTADQWRQCIEQCRRHPIRSVIHQDPFTYRAFSKPRGYAGDAVMLDYIYGREESWPPPSATLVGQRIFNFTTMAPASKGVRARRAFVASLMDRLAEDFRRPHVLSIAAGHLREAGLSIAARRKELGRYAALDADVESLREVQRCYGALGVETIHAGVRNLISGKLSLGSFHLIYSTGLFDYVQGSLGRRLVSSLFRMLYPGGRLLVANFMPGIRDIGYMETFMDWSLVYRTRQEMIALTMEIPQAEIREVLLTAEDNQNIIFAQVRRH